MQGKSLVVLFSVMAKVKNSPMRDEFITEVENLLIERGLCTESDLKKQKARFDSLIKELVEKMGTGLSYNEAFRRLRLRYPEFTNLTNLKNLN